jgi:hypothetical protein
MRHGTPATTTVRFDAYETIGGFTWFWSRALTPSYVDWLTYGHDVDALPDGGFRVAVSERRSLTFYPYEVPAPRPSLWRRIRDRLEF